MIKDQKKLYLILECLTGGPALTYIKVDFEALI